MHHSPSISPLYRHHLRVALGPLFPGDRTGLHRSRRQQIDHPCPHHPWPASFFNLLNIAHPLHAVFHDPDRNDFQSHGLPDRDLGRQLRTAPARPPPRRHPPDLLGGTFYSIDMFPPFWQKISPIQPSGLPGSAAFAGVSSIWRTFLYRSACWSPLVFWWSSSA